ncbi:MAG: hypothetical protein JWP92_826, partial [Caulobacter sp.]|nr:hypothetical protein [Caulobacter sp.]
MLRPWLTALGALATLSLATAAHAAAPTFTPNACVGDFTGAGHKVDCGTLTVDEAWDKPGGRRITIPVAIVRASARKPGLPPVVVLHGGPGGASIASLPHRLKSPAQKDLVAVDQDWIYFDQRGTGQSQPGMDCPGADLTDAGPASAKDADTLVACLQGFKAQGYDLSRYNAIAIAHDVQSLRQALGLKQIDLFGGSYGTRIEAAIQTHAPQGVRAVVQDSPWPPEADWTVGGPEMVSGSIDIVMAKCAAVAQCAKRYPNLKARLAKVAERWLAGPQTVKGKTYVADDLGGYLMDAAYFEAKGLPRDLEKIIAGDLAPVDAFMESRDYYSEGDFLTHVCKEEIPFESRAKVAAGAKGDPVAQLLVAPMQRLHDVCARIDVGPPQASEQRPVKTKIPTLFLAAEIDPGCPPALTRAAAKGYAGSQVVIVTNATHGV